MRHEVHRSSSGARRVRQQRGDFCQPGDGGSGREVRERSSDGSWLERCPNSSEAIVNSHCSRTERTVRDVRDDCFAGEKRLGLDDARRRARTRCADEYGQRKAHHDAAPAARALHCRRAGAPITSTDRAIRRRDLVLSKVGADQHAQVARSLYSLLFDYRGHQVRARADSSTVRSYDAVSRKLIKSHARVAPGRTRPTAPIFPRRRRSTPPATRRRS